MNAAEFLYDFFDKESVYDADQAGYRFPDLVAALDEIGKATDQWEREGRRVKGFRSSLPRWRKSVTMAFTDTGEIRWDEISGPVGTSDFMSDADKDLLMYAAELLDSCTLRFTEEQRNNVRNLVSEANTVLRGIADGMPDGLALHLSRLLRETETALDEYAITGDFVLDRAVSRLREALDIAMVQTPEDKQSMWDKVKDLGKQLAIGYMIEAPALALTAAQMFPPQIGG